MNEDARKVLNRQVKSKEDFHWLVIREKKDKDRDEFVLETHQRFKDFCKMYSMNNFTMGLDKLLNLANVPLELEYLQNQVDILTAQVEELIKSKDLDEQVDINKELINKTF